MDFTCWAKPSVQFLSWKCFPFSLSLFASLSLLFFHPSILRVYPAYAVMLSGGMEWTDEIRKKRMECQSAWIPFQLYSDIPSFFSSIMVWTNYSMQKTNLDI